MKSGLERRSAFRMDVVSRAVCRLSSGDEEIRGSIRDISIAGLFMETDAKPSVSVTYDVEIILTGKTSSMVIKNMSGRVVRTDDNGLAIQFDERFEWFAMVPIYFHTNSDSSR